MKMLKIMDGSLVMSSINNSFYNSVMLCLRVAMLQMIYIISALHRNVTVGSEPLPCVFCHCNIWNNGRTCTFQLLRTIKNDNGSEVCNSVDI